MIAIHRPAPRRLDVVVRGTLDEDAVRGGADELRDALEEGTALLLDLREFDGMTVGGLARDLAESLHLVGRLARCRRIALVAAERWLRAAGRVDGALLPGVEVRAFDVDGIDEARAWLDGEADGEASDGIDAATAARPAVRLVAGTRPGLLEMVIDGYLDDDDVERLVPAFERALAGDAPIDLLARVDALRGFDPKLLADRDTWRLKRMGLSRLRRYALVTSIDWLGGTVALLDRLVSPELRTFAPDEEAAARAWLDEGASADA